MPPLVSRGDAAAVQDCPLSSSSPLSSSPPSPSSSALLAVLLRSPRRASRVAMTPPCHRCGIAVTSRRHLALDDPDVLLGRGYYIVITSRLLASPRARRPRCPPWSRVLHRHYITLTSPLHHLALDDPDVLLGRGLEHARDDVDELVLLPHTPPRGARFVFRHQLLPYYWNHAVDHPPPGGRGGKQHALLQLAR